MELSISFTDAELVALADVLGESLPDLGPSTLDHAHARECSPFGMPRRSSPCGDVVS